jgi:hypothetical protein
MRQLRLIGIFSLIFLISNALAAEKIACTPMTEKAEIKEIHLTGADDSETVKVYFFKNIRQEGIWIDHPVENPSASAGWASYLRAGNSSALLVNRKNFTVNCAIIKSSKIDFLDCKKAVEVCVSKVTMKSVRKGTYWLAEDKSWDDLITGLAKRGVHFLADK